MMLEGDIFNTVAAVIFLLGGAAMLIFTLKHSLKKSDRQRNAQLGLQQSEQLFWQQMSQAVSAIDKLANEVEGKSEERSQQLARLTQEASNSIQQLEEALDEAKEALKSPAANGTAREQGRVVDFKSASEALVGRTHRKVYDAFDRGMTIQEISKDTGLQLGEIELILTLRDKTDDKTNAG